MIQLVNYKKKNCPFLEGLQMTSKCTKLPVFTMSKKKWITLCLFYTIYDVFSNETFTYDLNSIDTRFELYGHKKHFKLIKRLS